MGLAALSVAPMGAKVHRGVAGRDRKSSLELLYVEFFAASAGC